MTDKRFTISLEFCGYPKARHVLRFCGDFISSHPSKGTALIARAFAIASRRAAMRAA